VAKDKIHPWGWIVVRENVRLRKRRYLGRRLAHGGDGARKGCGLGEKMCPQGERCKEGGGWAKEKMCPQGERCKEGGGWAKEKMCPQGDGFKENMFPREKVGRERMCPHGDGVGLQIFPKEKVGMERMCPHGDGAGL